jgi:perosamine synthetase
MEPFNKFIPLCEPLLDGNEKKYVTECLDENWISSSGKYHSGAWLCAGAV